MLSLGESIDLEESSFGLCTLTGVPSIIGDAIICGAGNIGDGGGMDINCVAFET